MENIGFGDYMGKYVGPTSSFSFLVAKGTRRVLGHSVGAKDGDAWQRMRSCVDPHFGLDKAFELLPVMISDTDEWIEKLPRLPMVKRDEKNNKLTIKAEELVSELPFLMVARRLFGDLIDEKVIQCDSCVCSVADLCLSLVLSFMR
jgi:cytochrome P450